MSGQLKRRILDHINHDDLVGEGPLSLEFVYDAATAPPTDAPGQPTAGQLRMNAAAQNAATILWPSNTTETGSDASNVFGLLDVGSKIYLQDKNDSSLQQMYQMTAPKTNNGAYTTLPVIWLSGGAPLAEQRIVMAFTGGTGGAVLGAWQPFIADPGWGTSTLRYRWTPGGMQFDGAQLGSNGAELGIVPLGRLPPAYTPVRQTILMITVIPSAGTTYGWGFLVFQVNGVVAVWYSTAANQFVVNGLVALD